MRQSEADHVRFVLTAPDATDPARPSDAAGRRVRAVHRRGGEDRVLGEATVPGRAGDPVVLAVSARGQDYALLAGVPDAAGPSGLAARADPVDPSDPSDRAGAPGTGGLAVVAVADGRTLDSVATGGFLGLWIGVHATSNGAPTGTVAHVERFEYLLPTGEHHPRTEETHP